MVILWFFYYMIHDALLCYKILRLDFKTNAWYPNSLKQVGSVQEGCCRHSNWNCWCLVTNTTVTILRNVESIEYSIAVPTIVGLAVAWSKCSFRQYIGGASVSLQGPPNTLASKALLRKVGAGVWESRVDPSPVYPDGTSTKTWFLWVIQDRLLWWLP
jgi:hypothetical protein